MPRNLLHKSKLQDFRLWLAQQGIAFREGRGEYQVMQVQAVGGLHGRHWQCIFDRDSATEHYTVASPLERLVTRYIIDRKNEKKEYTGTPRKDRP